MSLDQYWQKRDFDNTKEPKGKLHREGRGCIFTVQKHAASHLHYDFRLSMDGVLKSWAVPKGPSYNPKEKRLAVQVEDHPFEYAQFEGTIPEGEYGAGTVMLWDAGEWEPEGDAHEGYQRGKLVFSLKGHKLKGKWVLLRTGKGAKPNWLLFKYHDEYAHCLTDQELLESPSVKTGRQLNDIAHIPHSPSNKRGSKAPKADKPFPIQAFTEMLKKLPGAVKSPAMPKSLTPSLATLVKEVPEGEGWLYEIKFDGYRLLAIIDQGQARLMTRNGNDWTHKFPRIAQALAKLPLKNAIIDGELVALDASGVSKFQLLQNAIMQADAVDLYFYAFDMPYCQGYDLRQVALIERKSALKQVLVGLSPLCRYSEHLAGPAPKILSKACSMAVEGVVAKRESSVYHASRSMDWLKIKCIQRQEFVITGYTDPKGTRSDFGALLLGYYDEHGALQYAGKVGTGFDHKNLHAIYQRLQQHQSDTSPYIHLPRMAKVSGVHWLHPVLVAEVEFAEWTQDGCIRHPSFKGLREDKPAAQIVAEHPSTEVVPSSNVIAGVSLTHADKLMYPTAKINKVMLGQYYHRHLELILPHVIHRPLTVLRCPQGVEQECFYQKHVDSLSRDVHSVAVKEQHGGVRRHLVIRDEHDLIQLVQMGVLELHPWSCQADDLEHPDRMVFDLDPGPDVGFTAVIEAAQVLMVGLDALGVQSFVKTSGKKGLHVVVPLIPQHTWAEVKAFAKAMAEKMVELAPDRYVSTISKAARAGKILVDYWRNERGATCVAPYSTRATLKASISAPVTTEELAMLKSSDQYTLSNIEKRLSHLKRDPWQDYWEVYQSLAKKLIKQR